MKRAFFSAVAVLLVCFACARPAYPQAVPVSSGSWSNASTWNTPPVNNGSVQLNGGYTVTFGPGDSYTGSPTWFNGLGVGNGTPAALNITGGTLTTGAWYVGHQTTGTINLSGGSLIANGNQMLFGWTNTATMNITGGTMSMTGAGTYNIGHGAQSFINVSGNGVASFGGGLNVLNGSQVNNNGGTVAINSGAGQQITVQAGSINQTAGTTTVGDNLWLGANALSGTVNLSGGTWNQNNFLRLGVFGSGNGIINQTSGTFAMGSTFEVWAGSKSSYNLNGGTFRVTGTNVNINNASGGMDFNITGSSGNVTVDTGTNNFSTPNTSTFDNAAATLTKIGSGTLTIAGAGSQLRINNGALDMQAGTLETQSTLSIGASNGTASGTMSGGILRTGYLAASNLAVGNGGTGSLTQSSGTVDVGTQANTVIGWNAGGTGTYTLNGGAYSTGTNNTFVGFSGGAGTVNVNGGSFSAYNLIVGGNSAASGTLNLNGGTLSLANTDGFYVSSNGTLNLNSGGSLPATTLRVSSGGKLNFNGGTGNSSLNIIAGGGAGGTVDLNGQTLGNGSWGNLVAGGTGAVLRNSGTTAATIPNSSNVLWIWDGAQNLTIDTPAASLSIASRITSSGQTTATGIIKTGTGTLVLSGGNDYTGSTAINAGTLQIANSNALGSTAGGTVVADGARLLLSPTSGNITVGNEALTISGTGSNGWALRSASGANTWGGKITLAANSIIQAATGAGLTLDVASGDAVDLGIFTATFNGAGTHTVNDPIVGTGGLTKAGSGSLILSGNSTYTGATSVSLGKLFVNGDNSAATGAVTIDSGATLGGSGTIGGGVTVNGILSPGNSPGVLSVASLVLGGSSTSLFEINNTTRGTGYDGVDLTGVSGPTYGGVLSLVFGNGSAFGNTDVFDLFNFSGSASGAFSSVTSTGFYAGTWTNNNDGTFKLEKDSQTLTFSQATGNIVVVPEPGAFVLAGVGIAAAAWARRRLK